MRFHGVRRRRAPDEAYRRRGPSVRPGQALRPWLRLFPDRLFEGPPHRSAQEERQGRIRGHLVGSGLQRDRREGEGHHRRQGAAGACHGAGSASVGQVLHEALHERAGLGERVHARRCLQSVEGKRLHPGHRRGQLCVRHGELQDDDVHRPQLRRRHSPQFGGRAAARPRKRRAYRAGGSALQQLHRVRRRMGAHQPRYRLGLPAGHVERAGDARPVRQAVCGR